MNLNRIITIIGVPISGGWVMLCGALGGFGMWIPVYPVDVIKVFILLLLIFFFSFFLFSLYLFSLLSIIC